MTRPAHYLIERNRNAPVLMIFKNGHPRKPRLHDRDPRHIGRGIIDQNYSWDLSRNGEHVLQETGDIRIEGDDPGDN
ncbi:hypothetical protein GCM10027026_46310 [Myroides odoratimimus subsp. xuanwuensis]